MSQQNGYTHRQVAPQNSFTEGEETSMTVPDDGLALPPIRTNSPITVQPSSNAGDVNQSYQSRASSMYLDWVSASRSQLSVFSGTYFLSSVDQLEIQQVVDLSSLLGVSRNGAQYRVKVPRAETIFLAIEESQTCQRDFLRSSRQLTLNVMDPSGETAFVIKKSLSWGCVPAFLHKITVESSEYIGSVEQNFTLIGLSFTVYDDSRRPLCYIEGPNVYSCCMPTNTQFQIISVDKSRQVASLIHQCDQLSVDYSMLLTFTPNTDAKLKGLLLGATFLLEFLFFEYRR